MSWKVSFYAAILFFILTPGVLLSIPPKSGRLTVAAVHAVVFAVIFHFLLGFLNVQGTIYKEGFKWPERPKMPSFF